MRTNLQRLAWNESGFSGDDHLIYETPVTNLRWQVSVNRYGHPTARLFIMASGGGPQVLEARLLSVSEADSDAEIATAAREWAESVIADGSAIRQVLFPPASEDPDGQE